MKTKKWEDNKLLTDDTIKVIKEFHQHFVFTETDKMSTNVSIVCKAHYVKTIIKELCDPEIKTYEEIKLKKGEEAEQLKLKLIHIQKEIKRLFNIEADKPLKMSSFTSLLKTIKIHLELDVLHLPLEMSLSNYRLK